MSTLKVNKLENTATANGGIAIDNTGHVQVDGMQMPTAGPLSNRNLIINGAMAVAQRGTTSTSTGYQTVDRFTATHANTDESPTYAQVDVSSGTDPYNLGFRKAFKITNGNQSSGAGATDQIVVQHRIEAQNIASSGWNYTSTTSYVTLCFWIRSSVSQDFKGLLKTEDGTEKSYPFATGSLTADTWTKVTKTIPGHADLQFDNNNGSGMEITISGFQGTDLTGSVTEDAWMTFSGSTRTADQTSTWYTTDDATLEITGVQLEVGEMATPFEHRSYGDELAKCQRYLFRVDGNSSDETALGSGQVRDDDTVQGYISLPVTMRSHSQTITESGISVIIGNTVTLVSQQSSFDEGMNCVGMNLNADTGTPFTVGRAAVVRLTASTSSFFQVTSEL